jgi:dephospho-CoA kinase
MVLPLKIGLTGGIASGKTTVSNRFANLGVPIIDADVIAHAIINNAGHLDRAKLRKQIFTDKHKRQRLETILHPRIKKNMQEQIWIYAKLREPYCLLSIPLLLETRMQGLVDRVLVVDCSPPLQRQRLLERDGLTPDEIKPIIRAQTTPKARLTIANDVIYNDGSLDDLQQQIEALHKDYCFLGGSFP